MNVLGEGRFALSSNSLCMAKLGEVGAPLNRFKPYSKIFY